MVRDRGDVWSRSHVRRTGSRSAPATRKGDRRGAGRNHDAHRSRCQKQRWPPTQKLGVQLHEPSAHSHISQLDEVEPPRWITVCRYASTLLVNVQYGSAPADETAS